MEQIVFLSSCIKFNLVRIKNVLMYTKIEIEMVSTSFLQCLDRGVTIKNATIDSVSQLG